MKKEINLENYTDEFPAFNCYTLVLIKQMPIKSLGATYCDGFVLLDGANNDEWRLAGLFLFHKHKKTKVKV